MARFERGNPGGPGGARPGAGRKPAPSLSAGRRLFGGVREEDLAAIIDKAVAQAKDGDVTARAWLFDRVFGRPGAADALAEQEALRAGDGGLPGRPPGGAGGRRPDAGGPRPGAARRGGQ